VSVAPTTEASGELAKPYKVTPRERVALEAHLARINEQAPSPSLKLTGDGKAMRIALDHPDSAIGFRLLMQAIGTADSSFLDGILHQLVNASSAGQAPDQAGLNFMMAVVKGIEPRDQVEAMLAAQMAAVHSATMTFARRLAHVDNIAQQDSAERAFNKLARTFAAQVEALKRYRTGGEQRVIVQHVTVNEGGQAIVGTVAGTAGGGGAKMPPPTP